MAETNQARGCLPAALPTPPPICIATDALLLDLDGTIAPIEARPEMVVLSGRMLNLLEKLATGSKGRIAIISGRTLDDVERLTGGVVRAIAGIHGLEQRIGDSCTRAAPAPGLADAVARLEAFAAKHPGALVEDKGVSVTIHYRLAPAIEAKARALAEELAAEHGLALQTGKMVFELRTPGANKAAAVAAFMADPCFAGSHPWFVGDDDTDEAAFEAVRRHGGAGVLVGAMRPTSAGYRLADVAAVEAWLASAVAAGDDR